jgi:hypothetical protein
MAFDSVLVCEIRSIISIIETGTVELDLNSLA